MTASKAFHVSFFSDQERTTPLKRYRNATKTMVEATKDAGAAIRKPFMP
jgi:hypothetical protein